MLIIGITGTIGAGKGTIVDYLVNSDGFQHFSVRAFLTEEIVKRGLEVNRDSMVMIANEMRTQHSPAYIAEQLYNKAVVSKQNCIIESIRTTGEVEALKSKGNFYLFAVDAKPEIRFKRIKDRKSATDQIDFETFIQNEKREMQSTNPNEQNILQCIKMADYIFENNGSIIELNQKVKEIIHDIIGK